MEEEFDNRLELKDENGNPVIVNVLDILDENEFGKEFIIYTLQGDETNIYASILHENGENYSLDTLENDEQIAYVNKVIDELSSEE